ncbi:hypothetical protein GCM10011531_28130 [Aquaticitalea lipolytica]|uniref:Uncharacterized protein n=1 Tax=Aquaticitalea lipolytica TaxID=1247562 RepID=A0A8J2TSS2_9FLAO|nr:hypothetical protein GCM10011531_28130 [Aquaticitalea lipolytica]
MLIKNIIHKFYSSILNFTTYTGFKLTNEDARAVLIFVFVLLFNVGTILGLFGFKISELNKFILVITFLGIFYFSYRFFSNNKRKMEILQMYRGLELKNKIVLNILSIAYVIMSTILFLKFHE